MSQTINYFWFRRDLRLTDNAGLYHSLKEGKPVQCIFIFDREILDKLENKKDRRINFIHLHLEKLNAELKKVNLDPVLSLRFAIFRITIPMSEDH